jgi:hypothetical protein
LAEVCNNGLCNHALDVKCAHRIYILILHNLLYELLDQDFNNNMIITKCTVNYVYPKAIGQNKGPNTRW